MLGSPAGPGVPSQRGLWPLAPAPSGFTADGFGKYGVYSLFPGGPSFGSALYSHASIGRFASGHVQPSSGNIFHSTHKDSLFSSAGYTFGAPTPPPGSPYSPVPVTQLELLAKSFNSNIIIQQPSDYPPSPKKIQVASEKRCDEKCCSLKQKTCSCQPDSPIKGSKFPTDANGCSRTNPIEWTGVNIKKEPGNPCQVAEITTSVSPVIKLEVASPTQKNGDIGSIINGNIPVGIAVARQRVQQQDLIASPTLPPTGLLTTVNSVGQIKEIARISEIPETAGTGMAANATGGGAAGGTLLQCTDDRTALASWPMGNTQGGALTTPTLWQYPAPVPMDSMVPLPVPMPPVGFQLVRDPNTGGLLLLPTTNIEPIQQTVVWPSYPQPPSVLIPPIPPPPLQLLGSTSSDYLTSSTTLQQTQTHSTRLVAVTTDTKRKIPLPIPATTLIKIETDSGGLEQAKTMQTVSTISTNTGTVYTDQPLVTTHVIYQHPTNLILSQQPSNETACRSQATSPVTCLTPPPEVITPAEEETLGVQDASNQTESPFCSEDDSEATENKDAPKTADHIDSTNPETEAISAKYKFAKASETSEKKIPEPTEVASGGELVTHSDETTSVETQPKLVDLASHDSNSHIVTLPGLETRSGNSEKPDLSGLELLSNSIVEFESSRSCVKVESESQIGVAKDEDRAFEQQSKTAGEQMKSGDQEGEAKKMEPPAKLVEEPHTVLKQDDNFGGLDLLCALAEQRILEESVLQNKPHRERAKERKKEKRKSKKHSSDEPKRKRAKYKQLEDIADENIQCECDALEIEEPKPFKNVECKCKELFKSYKSAQSEEEVRKFLKSKSQPICCQGDWPCMNPMELDMRMKLADLQRQYREKQKELSKLKIKRHHPDCSKKKSKKKTYLDKSTSPPLPTKPEKREILKPPTLVETPTKPEEVVSEDTETLDEAPDRKSSSKKRKVGRPKKISRSSSVNISTETIVAKKPKTGSIVGYLLAAKEKLQMKSKYSPNPPKYIEETVYRAKKNKNNNDIIVEERVKSCKIRPKLKAEATVKTYEDDDVAWEGISESDDDMEIDETIGVTPVDGEEDATDVASQEVMTEAEKPKCRCTLTGEHLEIDKLRVLTAMGGLFYAGHLNAVEPPDVYSITLDGERGNKPHIMSREEILRDAIVEVPIKSVNELTVGTRLCAYWSQQYRCLYPGSVAEPGTPNPELDSKFVSVEFDDGDSGRIAIEDIRLLPSNYPIMEYDPNPLLSLSKRKRRTSTCNSTEERKLPRPQDTLVAQSPKTPDAEKENKDINKIESDTHHKERKRLKKKKKDKLKQKLMHEDKKKKKKHKCHGENCKHKKHHKKHRKHKKHHHRSDDVVEDKLESEESVMNTSEENEEVTIIEEVSSTEVTDVENVVPNPEDEVTMDDILESPHTKTKKIRDRQESCESSKSKMSAFLPARQLWSWSGKGYKRPKGKGRNKKEFYKTIQRGKESIMVGDAAVFLSTGRPDRPYIGRIEAMWEKCGGNMTVKVKWFYHPEETVGSPLNFQYPGALFESPHVDENDVQTISHKCEVLPLKDYTAKLGDDPQKYAAIYDNNDIYYLAGYYDPTTTTLKMEPGIPFKKTD